MEAEIYIAKALTSLYPLGLSLFVILSSTKKKTFLISINKKNTFQYFCAPVCTDRVKLEC